jgi:hypothetical protein
MAILNIRIKDETKNRLITAFYTGKANGNWKNWDEFINSIAGFNKGYSI